MISIIVPVYNVEKYIVECIESILVQTYTNWELFLVNDGSTDSSGDICQGYAHTDNRIIYVGTENRGACHARNIGLEKANGEYIFFVDSDDMLTPDALRILFDKLAITEAELVCGECQGMHENGKDYNYKRPVFPDKITSGDQMLRDVLTYNTLCSIWGKLYKKDLIGSIRFEENLKLGQDICFLTSLFSEKSCSVLRCSEKIYRYRILQNSISHSKQASLIAKIQNYIENMIQLRIKYNKYISENCVEEFSCNICRNILYCIYLTGLIKKVESWQLDILKSEVLYIKTINDGYTRDIKSLLASDKPGISWTLTFRHLIDYAKDIARKLIR